MATSSNRKLPSRQAGHRQGFGYTLCGQRTCSGGEANLYNENFAIYSILIFIIEYLLYDIYSEKLSNQVFKELFSPKRYSCSLPAICRRQAKIERASCRERVCQYV